MQVNTTIINTDNKYVDRVDYITQEYGSKEVININDKEITIIEANDDTSVVIIVIAVSILLVLVLLAGARYLYNRMRSEKAKAEQIKNTQKNLHRDGQIRVIPRGKGFESKIQSGVEAEEGDAQVPEGADKNEYNAEVYEEQYDPNQEFRIFGIGDKTKGGVQSLQQKMNMADEVSEEGSSSEEQENEEKSEGHSSHNTVDKLMPPNPQSDNKCDTSMVSSNQLLVPESQKTPLGSIKSSDKEQNFLPEDNEIVEDEEEEEEDA